MKRATARHRARDDFFVEVIRTPRRAGGDRAAALGAIRRILHEPRPPQTLLQQNVPPVPKAIPGKETTL